MKEGRDYIFEQTRPLQDYILLWTWSVYTVQYMCVPFPPLLAHTNTYTGVAGWGGWVPPSYSHQTYKFNHPQ